MTMNSPQMSNSTTYTTLVFSSSDGVTYEGFYRGWADIYVPEGKTDFQVKAFERGYVPSNSMFGGQVETTLAESDWSNTQTVSIP
jgi:hypothetical protein